MVDDESPLNLNPLYWLYIKISPNGEFSGETELFVQKDSIVQFIEDLTRIHNKTKGHASIKCAGWGSYINFEFGESRKLCISGLLNKRWDEENNHLKFKFTSDKTVIPVLTELLKKLTDYQDSTS